MRGGKAALAVFVPSKDEAADEKEDAEETDEEESKDSLDTLLGHAFDAHEDGDRNGFIRSMRAAIKTSK